ncbi:hypothetical protein Patl1_21843 [Pistacia atlantica]|uniref:Uncharacterized protein n=1 Tax=Pistacia atlantica TaxID=434234 RepID=A0ACC1BLY4_9ROSI|nr:hypothetical protein Patl1_21843 [Pistacia atlantica]
MASISISSSLSFPSVTSPPNANPFPRPISTFRTPKATRDNSTTRTGEASMNIDNLKRFFDLNVGNWSGSFHQFDGTGNLMQKIRTKLSVNTYGEDELISLIQTLYIKQPSSSTMISGYEEEPEWAEYKVKETNMFTVDKYQQIGFFPNERAFSLRYQTAGMLETVLRQGVLGEDDTGEESPKNLKLPSRRPAIVCENCLYSQEKDRRARAFHIMDPRGNLDMFLIFLEDRDRGTFFPPSLDSDVESIDKIVPFLGNWKGHSVTKRSGVYGATIAEADTVALLKMDDKGQLIQVYYLICLNQFFLNLLKLEGFEDSINWNGTEGIKFAINIFCVYCLMIFLQHLMEKQLRLMCTGREPCRTTWLHLMEDIQYTFLPGGMYLGCPCDIAKSVEEWKPFHLEFGWVETPGKRQRLVRTYDAEGLAVSSTYFSEIKL